MKKKPIRVYVEGDGKGGPGRMADGSPESMIEAKRYMVGISPTARKRAGRCQELLDALPDLQKSNVLFVAALTGGSVPSPDGKFTLGAVVEHALAMLEANLDPEAKAVRQAAELAYQDYCRRIQDGYKGE